MRISYLKEFIDFCNDLNMTAAARRLNMSVSALSTHLNALEKEVGTPLISRTARPTLTPEGQAFFDYAFKIVDLYSEGIETCRALHDQASYTLRVDKLIRIGGVADCFRKFLANYNNSHSNTNVVLTQCDNVTIIESLRDQQVDVAIFATLAPEYTITRIEELYNIRCVLFTSEEIGAWVSKDCPLAKKETLSLEDIKDYTILHSHKWRLNSWRNALKYVFGKIGATPKMRLSFHNHLADYAYEQLGADELLLISDATAEQAGLLRNREDRTMVFFDPPLYISAYVCYNLANENPALPAFIDSVNAEFCDCVSPQ